MTGEMKAIPLIASTRKTFAALLIVAAVAFGLIPAPQAEAADVAGTFSQGRSRFSISGGSGYAFNETYFVLGVGASYYVADGLSAGLDVEWWSGGEPAIVKVAPSVQYVFYQVPSFAPYLGAFYRRSYVENLQDLGSAGGRAGVYMSAGPNAYFGAGIVHETYFDCDETTYASCSDTYPEVSVSVAF
jgi:hypothetical protein